MEAKIRAEHLRRRAYVYIRQSTARQVFENTESTKRQYALAEQAAQLGWSTESVIVVDEDLGCSGSTRDGRSGFKRLCEAVAHGEAGAIFALEISRLARSSQDWQQLLTLCAVAGVLVVDEQTVYDPRDGNDKLLLDLKGTMSEAELHWLRLRLTGARRNKASRGELRIAAPAGYVWGGHGFEKDPDEAVRQAIQTVFDRFAIEPAAWAVVRWARATGLRIPARSSPANGPGQPRWQSLGLSRLCAMLHNPTYAGTYAYGRQRTEQILVDGKIRTRQVTLDPEQWAVRIDGAHKGYIDWETFMANKKKLRDNMTRREIGGSGAPREGQAMLAGLLLCGRCGRRMHPAYQNRGRGFRYQCSGERDKGQVLCWTLAGAFIDEAVEELFLATMVPSELDLCLAIDREVTNQTQSLERQWQLRLEKAEYEARLAERRYMAVDPDNRVVARTLEHDWELCLREVEETRRDLAAAKREQCLELGPQDQRRIRELARDLPQVWRSATTTAADRQAMLRLVIEAIAIEPIEVPSRQTNIRVQWKSGAISELTVSRPGRRDATRTSDQAATRIAELAAAGLRDEQIAEGLNAEGLVTGVGKRWNTVAVRWARGRHRILLTAPDLPRSHPLPDRHPDGRYSIRGAVQRFDVSDGVVRRWIRRGLVEATREDYQQHHQVYWLRIDDQTAERLEEVAERARKKRKPRK